MPDIVVAVLSVFLALSTAQNYQSKERKFPLFPKYYYLIKDMIAKRVG